MDKKGKKVVTSLAVLAGLASGAGALNAFANKTVKAMLYRHHKEDDKPSILETKFNSQNRCPYWSSWCEKNFSNLASICSGG